MELDYYEERRLRNIERNLGYDLVKIFGNNIVTLNSLTEKNISQKITREITNQKGIEESVRLIWNAQLIDEETTISFDSSSRLKKTADEEILSRQDRENNYTLANFDSECFADKNEYVAFVREYIKKTETNWADGNGSLVLIPGLYEGYSVLGSNFDFFSTENKDSFGIAKLKLRTGLYDLKLS